MEKNSIVFEITQHIGTLTEYPNGWTKEINMVAWNDAKPKFDIRDWSEDHSVMSRGITLYEKEAKTLFEALKTKFK